MSMTNEDDSLCSSTRSGRPRSINRWPALRHPGSYACAFCGNTIPPASADLRTLKISTPGERGAQELFVHRACLVSRLHTAIPLGQTLEGCTGCFRTWSEHPAATC